MADQTRRRVLRTVAGVGAVGGLSALTLLTGTQPVVAASFSADDEATTTHDGEVERVTIAPTGTVTWTGLDTPAQQATVAAEVRDDESWATVATTTLDIDGLAGETAFALPDGNSGQGVGAGQPRTIDLTEHPFGDAHFAAGDGGQATTTVEVRILVTLTAETTHSATASDSFEVTVTNAGAGVDVSGSANTGVGSDSEVGE